MDRKGCADVPECDLDKDAPCTVWKVSLKFYMQICKTRKHCNLNQITFILANS